MELILHCREEFLDIVFGVFKTQVDKGGRGAQVILGLVRNTERDIRPSLISQTDIRSLNMDFVHRTLTLSRGALIPSSADYVPLVDLRAFFRAPVQQYVARVKTMVVNDQVLILDSCFVQNLFRSVLVLVHLFVRS